ncbi:MAG: hypothetical protein CMH64_02840 [Nanoarchaeota archaeon]|nr:hypothetical protein [Nanoarchaeota archaeon]|tara:strand:- start:1282 stop:2766 length:1485 start_codon:yes stop_codon:yes gene_type:complete
MKSEIENKNLYEKALSFLDKNSNPLLIGILIFAFILRLKYYNINSALWFDEVEYLVIAKNWAFNIPYNIPAVRPMLLPFVAFIFYKIGLNPEFPLRILELILSVAGVYFIYLLAKEMYNKQTGFIASFLMSIFYLHLFFTARILTGMPTTTLWTIVAYLFWKGYPDKSKLYIYLMGLTLGIGILLRFPVGLIGVVFLIYLLITENLKFLKNKPLWISAIISLIILAPYFIWYYLKFNQIAIISTSSSYAHNFLIPGYSKLFTTYLYSPINTLLILFVLSILILFFNLVLGFDLIKTNKKLQRSLFLFLLFLIPFLYFGTLDHIEPRYMFYIFPAVFILISLIILKIYNLIEKFNKYLALTFVLLVLIPSAFYQIDLADNMINSKKDSYIQFKEAGTWLKQNSNPQDVIVADGAPFLAYYAERKVIHWGKEETFKSYIKENNARYMILSQLERSPEWAYKWPVNNQDLLTPVQAYMGPNEVPILIIYEFSPPQFN